MSKRYQNAGIVVLFLAILAGALAGSPRTYIGISAECEDGLDNDGDNDIDFGDSECYEYPYADGNGESNTPNSERYASTYYVSLFDWHLQNSPPGFEEEVVCTALAFGYYNGDDSEAASIWVDSNNIDCTPYQP